MTQTEPSGRFMPLRRIEGAEKGWDGGNACAFNQPEALAALLHGCEQQPVAAGQPYRNVSRKEAPDE